MSSSSLLFNPLGTVGYITAHYRSHSLSSSQPLKADIPDFKMSTAFFPDLVFSGLELCLLFIRHFLTPYLLDTFLLSNTPHL